MKYLHLLFSILLFGFSHTKIDPNEFDNKLSAIVSKFKQEIMDKDECERQKGEADDLARDIENAIQIEGEYSPDEISTLKNLKKEAEAIEEYISSVGNCDNYMPSIDNFNLANRRVRGNIANVVKDKFCVDVISVTIGDYVSYLGENNTTKKYTVSYKLKAPNGMSTGSGTMGLLNKSVRHIYDNRENPSQKNIIIFGITCKEI